MSTLTLFFIKALNFIENVQKGFPVYGKPNVNANSFFHFVCISKITIVGIVQIAVLKFCNLLINQLG